MNTRMLTSPLYFLAMIVVVVIGLSEVARPARQASLYDYEFINHAPNERRDHLKFRIKNKGAYALVINTELIKYSCRKNISKKIYSPKYIIVMPNETSQLIELNSEAHAQRNCVIDYSLRFATVEHAQKYSLLADSWTPDISTKRAVKISL